MAMFNCGIDRRWCKDNTAYTGLSKGNNSMPFISSNGYYGYLPVYTDGTSAMETNDVNECLENNSIGTFPSCFGSQCSGNTLQYISNHITSERCTVQKITSHPRKRNSSEDMDECRKRAKKEEPVTKYLTDHEIQLEHSSGWSSEDLMETLLKHIHGCDMYSFYTTSDL